MLTEEIAEPEATTPSELHTQYERALGDVIREVGLDEVDAATDVGRDRLAALRDGDPPDPPLTVEEAATVLARSPSYPSADDLLVEVRDVLLLEMSTAVLDVEAIQTGLDGDLDATAIQQKIEGRREMTLDEYAAVRQFVAESGAR